MKNVTTKPWNDEENNVEDKRGRRLPRVLFIVESAEDLHELT
jgi:hypothetical protein